MLFGPFVSDGEFWRVVTSGFLHVDPIHLAFNMYALYMFGPAIEAAVGPMKTLAIYIGGLLGGAIAVLLFDFNTPTAGASGAVLGLAGGLAVIYKLNGIPLKQTSLGGILLLNLALPLLGAFNISFWGHAGGIVGGALLAFVVSSADGKRRRGHRFPG